MRPASNQLIALLPRTERAALLGLCERVQWSRGEALYSDQTPTDRVYFPLHGFASLLVPGNSTPAVEVAMVGPEGMLGTHLVLGVPASPVQAVVQEDGGAWRMRAADLRRCLQHQPELTRVLDRYVCVLLSQVVREVACMRFHPIGQRLARWLLMGHDRSDADRFSSTHDALARSLGVRRAGVTVAAGGLQAAGLIRYTRGLVTIVDRPGLEAAACSCYAFQRQCYATVMAGSATDNAQRSPNRRTGCTPPLP